MTFEKVEINTWKPQEVNESVEGIFLKAEAEVGANSSMLYSIEVEGKPIAVWGSAVLDTKMNAVHIGDLIKIVYLGKGEAKGGHNAPKLYDVYIDYEHREANATQAANATQTANATQAAPAVEASAQVAAPTQATPAQA